MKTLLFSAAFAAAAIAPTAANAQAIPAAVVAVVDLDKVTNDAMRARPPRLRSVAR